MNGEGDQQREHFFDTPDMRIGEDLVDGSHHWRIHYVGRVC